MKRRNFFAGTAAWIVAAVSISLKPSAAKASSSPVEHQVEILNFAFKPAKLKVKAGDRITWINKDAVPHTATAKDSSWNTGLLKKNQRGTITVKPGMKEDYFCRFHPTMTAKLDLG
ncbi:MAG: copper-binding protein [Rhodospirillaceae bacterium]|nr:copper-binding protein [Rhodospirillaceae bacterium]|tara:strand:+ start:568 stop:915 length:348 start_codon:yes stop_codon:yes gene_type:complete